jgi:multidrug efflux pump subunit AcrB
MKGIIAWFVRNGVAANLLMVFIIFGGVMSALSLPQLTFPEFGLDIVEVRVDYPGATPKEIEESIVRRIEEQLESVEGIQEIVSIASESIGNVRVELVRGENIQQRLDEIKSEVDRITSFPEQAEEPQVTRISNRSRVVQVVLYGDATERTLKELANQIKDELATYPSMSFIQVTGVRDYEISVEVSNDTLRSRGLTLQEIAAAVGRGSLELPGGDIQTRSEEVLLRTKGRNYNQRDFEDIVVIGDSAGAQIRLGDIATVRDDFRESDLTNYFNGERAALVNVFRVGDEKTLDIIADVVDYMETTAKPNLPPGISYALWDNDANALNDRLSLLVRNGAIGLLLVVIALALFLDIRLAFWTTVGIFISFIGTFAIMSFTGLTINMMTLFGFILSIGIVVDDAIVTGENIFSENERGVLPPEEAAIKGAQRVSTPVIFAVSTTIATFIPLLFIPSTIGKFLFSIPAIVICVLFLSLIESLFILPRHLSHLGPQKMTWRNPLMAIVNGLQRAVNWSVQRFAQGPLRRALEFATDRWGTVISAAVAAIMMTFGFLSAGFLHFNFFPEVESDLVLSVVELRQGAPVTESERVANLIRDIGFEVASDLEKEFPNTPTPIVSAVYMVVGGLPPGGGPTGPAVNIGASHQAAVAMELNDPETREFSALYFEQKWRQAVGSIAGARKLTFSSSLVGIGDPVQVEITAPTDEGLARSVQIVEQDLARMSGVFDIFNNYEGSKREIGLTLKPEARTYGVTVEQLAQQIRSAFFGAEALRVQRGREEVRVYVRLPENERNAITDLDDYRVRTPNGDFIPLSAVADLEVDYGPSTINRRNGRRVVSITGSIDSTQITGTGVATLVSSQTLPKVIAEVPGAELAFGGTQREQARAIPGILRNFGLALFAIYALLAMAFRSYTQPIIVMSAIPFGWIGAILGHVALGYNLTMTSIMGIVGLSGVIVNDALVMIDFLNEELEKGTPMREAIIEAAIGRFRPIFLTSLTTFLGVFPIILERSIQAQFLVPTAISLAFGILFGTFVLMLLVPALAMAQHDIGQRIAILRGRATAEV